jgi:uncharacterized protein
MRIIKVFSAVTIFKRPGDPVSGSLFLWAVFCIAYVPLNLFFISDILKGKYKFIYKIHAVSAITVHCMFIAGAAALLFLLLRNKRPIVRSIVFAISAVTIYAITLIDLTLFKIYSFHINGYIISEIMQPEFVKSSGIDPVFIIITTVKLAVIIIITALIVRIIFSLINKPLSARYGYHLVIKLIIIAVVFEKLFMIAVAYNRPAYIFRLAESISVVYINPADYIYIGFKKLFSVEDKKETFQEPLSGFDNMQYPRNGIYPDVKIKKPKNIIIIATESTRGDFITKDTTPYIWNISREKNGFMAANHFSSSNSTHMGIFSILYSINPYYSAFIKSIHAESVPIKILRSNGFSTHLYMSAPTEWHKMNYYLDQNFDTQFHPLTKESETRDREVSNAVIKQLQSPSNKPFLMFVFFDSSHYPFYSPKEFAKFSPHLNGYFKSFDFLYLETIRDQLINSYKNSLYYLDSLISEIDNALAKSGKTDSTMIFITGDHGCEFGESGKYFYSSSFNNHATKVPLVIRAEGITTLSKISSHADILPTALSLMEAKGYESNIEGKSITENTPNRYAIIAFQDALTPYRYQIISETGKLEINFKSSSFITGKFDLADKPLQSFPDEKNKINAIKQSINSFNKSTQRGSSNK